MNKYLTIACAALLAVCAALWGMNKNLRAEKRRLAGNQDALMQWVDYYKTEAGNSAASVQRLELSYSELKQHYEEICRTADELKVKVRRLQSVSRTATETDVKIQTVIRDSVVFRDGVLDSLMTINWSDAWVKIKGEMRRKELTLDIHTTDTLIQIVHRVPKKFLFIRWGTKAIRQEITSTNPHTTIVYSEYIELKKRKRK